LCLQILCCAVHCGAMKSFCRRGIIIFVGKTVLELLLTHFALRLLGCLSKATAILTATKILPL
jgi:hypothetical protein